MWYQRDAKRLEVEIESMNAEFPEFKQYSDANIRKIGWYGYLEVRGQNLKVRLEYPYYYPHIQPKIFVSIKNEESRIYEKFTDTVHKFVDGSICLFTWDDGVWSWKLEYKATDALYKLIEFFDLYKQGKIPNEHFSNFSMNVDYLDSGYIIPERKINFIEGNHGYANIRKSSITRNTHFVESLHFKDREKDDQINFRPTIPLAPGLDTIKWIFVPQSVFDKVMEHSSEREIIEMLHENEIKWITEFNKPVLIFTLFSNKYENYRVLCLFTDKKSLYQIHTSIGNWDNLFHRRMEEVLGKNTSSFDNYVVGIVGLGSLGSEIALNLTKAGIKNFILVDYDILTPENLSRHALDSRFLYDSKVEGVKLLLMCRNPRIKVISINESILEPGVRFDLLKYSIKVNKTLILVNSTANMQVDYLLNQFAIENNIITIHTYCNKNVTMGRILRTIPRKTGCFNCFAISTQKGIIPSFSDTDELTYHAPYDTGIPGVGMDISEVAIEASRIVLQTILELIPEEIPYPSASKNCILKVIHYEKDFSPATYYYDLKKNRNCTFCVDVNNEKKDSPEVEELFYLDESDCSVIIPEHIRDELIKIAETSDREQCGVIVGRKENNRYEITDYLEDNKAEDTSAFGCTRTLMGVWNDLENVVKEDPSVEYIGEWHNHTFPGSSPSGTDIMGMDEIMNSEIYNYPEEVLLIIVAPDENFSCWLFYDNGTIQKTRIIVD